MSYKTELKSNNADLAAILNTVNALPEATEPKEPVIEGLNVTENGTYTAPAGVDGYSPVTVNVPIPEPENLADVLDTQEAKLNELLAVLDGKAAGGGTNVVTVTVTNDSGAVVSYLAEDGTWGTIAGYGSKTVNVLNGVLFYRQASATICTGTYFQAGIYASYQLFVFLTDGTMRCGNSGGGAD